MAGETTLSSYIQALRENQQSKNIYSNIGKSLIQADVTDPFGGSTENFAANFAKALGSQYLSKLGRDDNNAYDQQINNTFSTVLSGGIPTGDEDIIKAANIFKLNNDFARASKQAELQDEIAKAVLVHNATNNDVEVETVKGKNELTKTILSSPQLMKTAYGQKVLQDAGIVIPEVVGPGINVGTDSGTAPIATKPAGIGLPFKSKEQKTLDIADETQARGYDATVASKVIGEGLSNENNQETLVQERVKKATEKASELGSLVEKAKPLLDDLGSTGLPGPLQPFSNITTKVGAALGSETAQKTQAAREALDQIIAEGRQVAREPGEGATSDSEGKLYANYLTTLDSSPAGNKKKVEMAGIFAKQNQDFANFANFYTSKDGAGTAEGLSEVWDYYRKENPYILPTPSEGGAVANPARKDFREVDLGQLLQRGRSGNLQPSFDLKALATQYQQKYGANAKSKFANDFGPLIDKMAQP